MITRQNIEDKIRSIGGTKGNPLCKDDTAPVNDPDFGRLEKIYEKPMPESYKSMYRVCGPFSFNKTIKVQSVGANAVSGDDRRVPVDYFYSIDKEKKCSIDVVLSAHEELIEKKLLPICDGELGDLICIDLNNGFVYYWYHEGEEGDNLFLIAEKFEDFILKLEVHEEDNADSKAVEAIEVKASPKLLEMLKKSGYGPKNK